MSSEDQTVLNDEEKFIKGETCEPQSDLPEGNIKFYGPEMPPHIHKEKHQTEQKIYGPALPENLR